MKENTASITAYTVLQGIMYIAKYSAHSDLVPKEMRELGQQVLAHSEEGRKRLLQIDKPGFRWGVKLREFIFLPGITLHYILRKRSIEERTREAIAQGVTQIVNLGAGFDSLILRLSREFPEINFIEIDHPDTQKFKMEALENASLSNLNYLSIDFTHQNLEGRLGSFDAFYAGRSTLFICEGVTMYLSEEEVNHMFSSIRKLSGAGTKFLFTAIEPQNSVNNNISPLLFLYLKLLGEPIKWSLKSEETKGFLDKQKCKLLSLDHWEDFERKFMEKKCKTKLHKGEFLVYAELE